MKVQIKTFFLIGCMIQKFGELPLEQPCKNDQTLVVPTVDTRVCLSEAHLPSATEQSG